MSTRDCVGVTVALLESIAVVTDATSTRIYGGEYPKKKQKNSAKKAIVVMRAQGLGGFGGYLQLERQPLDVRCYGNTPKDADDLYRIVRQQLKQALRQVIDGTLLHSFDQVGSAIALRDAEIKRPFVLSTWASLMSEDEAT